ncbi:MAG TPA: hypothetical protein VFP61_13455 [Acidimicrobiales bacterium]|nr:hypothetical protein [Acidimicrobiales bacterium]
MSSTLDAPRHAARTPLPEGPARRLGDHLPFLVVLAAGLALRGLVTYAVRPGLEFAQDSFEYLWDAAHPGLRDVVHPTGYPTFLRLVAAAGRHFTLVAVAQHLLGVAMGLATYALVRRLGAGRWGGAVAAAPVLLGGYQVVVEHFILSDVVFEALLVAAVTVVLWPARPSWRSAVAGGLLLAAADLTRTVGIAVVPVLAGYLLWRRAGGRVVVAFVAAVAAPLAAYAGWFDAGTGHFGLEAYDGYFLAGRVEPIADCRGLQLPAAEAALCPKGDAGSEGPDWYTWSPDSPLRNPDLHAADRNAVALAYAERMLAHRPFAYAGSVAGDFWSYLVGYTASDGVPGRDQTWLVPTSVPAAAWAPEYPPANPYIWEWSWPGNVAVTENRTLAVHGFDEGQVPAVVHHGPAEALHDYGRWVFLPGLAVLGAAVVAAWASVVALRRRRRHEVAPRVVALLAGGLALLALTTATAGRDPRYLLPVALLVWPAGVLGSGLLVSARRAAPGRLSRTRSTRTAPAS